MTKKGQKFGFKVELYLKKIIGKKFG